MQENRFYRKIYFQTILQNNGNPNKWAKKRNKDEALIIILSI